ncbi:T9SS type A sorting domain-containing protein [Flavivirga amylovorans]|uniref:T9SS type A sorting domain-containing protein n=1 Tax=Flavivirga amylovorans TaxID=870486 RepID=A0ABT8WWN0_9FLAO|nr:T9SS type A sorting domain-containing protein [Flavivirga amylovorans]MDO5985794.1 T9SS type A sorting domain-containing protein [Flavivirga amylovorans]
MKNILHFFLLIITINYSNASGFDEANLAANTNTALFVSNDCANAIPVTCGETVVGSTTDNTSTGGFTLAPDEWYKYEATGSPQTVTFSLCSGTDYDSSIALYKGNCVNLIAGFNDSSCGDDPEITINTDGVSDYYIAIEGPLDTSVGNFTLTVSCVPITLASNNTCATATPMNCNDSITGSTTENTDEGGDSLAPDAWFTYTGSGSAERLTFSLCNSTNFDTVLTIYDACDGNIVAIDDDGICAPASEVIIDTDGRSTYYIAIEGFGITDVGDYTLTLSCQSIASTGGNDTCEGATPLTCGTPVIGTLLDNTDQKGFSDAPDEWYVYEANGTPETVTLSLCNGTDYNSALVLLKGDCSNNEFLALSDDFCGEDAQIIFNTDGFSDYYVAVTAAFGDAIGGNFTLNVSCVPIPLVSNNDCANAMAVSCGDTIFGSTGDSSDTGGINDSADVWYKYTGTGSSELVTFSLCNTTDFATGLVVYDACGGEIMDYNNEFCSNFQSEITLAISGTETYYIAIEGAFSASQYGDYTLDISCQPPIGGNDLCEDATPIACGEVVSGDTTENTDSDSYNEQLGLGQRRSRDEWFTFTTPPSDEPQIIYLRTFNSEFEVFLTVYDTCGGNVVAKNDGLGVPAPETDATFVAESETTYLIKVEAFFNNSYGKFNLTLFCTPSIGGNDTCIGATEITCGDIINGDTSNNTNTGGLNESKDQWFKYVGTGTPENVIISTCGTSYDSVLTVFSSCDDSSTIIHTNDDFCGTGQSALSFVSDGVSEYWIALEGFSNLNAGAYTLEVTCTDIITGNDACSGAIPLQCNEIKIGDTSQNTTDTGGETAAPDHWYSYTGNGTAETITVSTCLGTQLAGVVGFDTFLTVYDACDGSVITSNDFGICGGQSQSARVEFQSNGTSTYIISVEGSKPNDVGIYWLDVSCENSSLSVNEVETVDISVYPNPANDIVNINSKEIINSVTIYSILGEKVMTANIDASSATIDITPLQNKGVYFLNFNTDTGVAVKKIVIK